MKKIISLITMVLMLALHAATAQTINVDDVDVNKGSENTLVVHLKNAANYVASGFTLVLPEGAMDGSGYSLELGKDVVNNHVVVSEMLSDNKLKVAIYSLSNSTFKNGNNGDVLLTLKFMGTGCKEGSYKGYLRGVELASISNKLVRLSDVTFNVNVEGNIGMLGDVDKNGNISLADILLMIDYMLGHNNSDFNTNLADINGDGSVSLADILLMVNHILYGSFEEQGATTDPVSNREEIFSNTVGDAKYIIYKEVVDENEIHTNPDGWKCYKSKMTLEIKKDGSSNSYVIDDNIFLDKNENHHGGMRPCLFIDYNSNQMYIFINSKDSRYNYSMDGYAYRSSLDNISFTRETVFSGANSGWFPYFTYDNQVMAIQHFSYAGYYVMTSTRNSDGTWSTQTVGSIDPDDFVTLSDQAGDVYIVEKYIPISYLSCPDGNHPHIIDLGLPSGTKWACCNVGADKPEAYGGYYAWGETEEKSTYNWNNYIHCDGSEETCHDLGSDIAGTKNDVAHVKWGSSWVLPSYEQIRELAIYCTHIWTSLNGVDGRKFTSNINGGTIFLPAAHSNATGEYWSSTQHEFDSPCAYALYLASDFDGWYMYTSRKAGLSVRPVCKASPALKPLSNIRGNVNVDKAISASPMY